MPGETTDNRTAAQLMRQYERVETIKNRLVRAKKLNGDATPKDVLKCLREEIPPDLFGIPEKSDT